MVAFRRRSGLRFLKIGALLGPYSTESTDMTMESCNDEKGLHARSRDHTSGCSASYAYNAGEGRQPRRGGWSKLAQLRLGLLPPQRMLNAVVFLSRNEGGRYARYDLPNVHEVGQYVHEMRDTRVW